MYMYIKACRLFVCLFCNCLYIYTAPSLKGGQINSNRSMLNVAIKCLPYNSKYRGDIGRFIII